MTIRQWCPSCEKLVDADLVVTYRNHTRTKDVSTCPCGRILWSFDVLESRARAETELPRNWSVIKKDDPRQLKLFE